MIDRHRAVAAAAPRRRGVAQKILLLQLAGNRRQGGLERFGVAHLDRAAAGNRRHLCQDWRPRLPDADAVDQRIAAAHAFQDVGHRSTAVSIAAVGEEHQRLPAPLGLQPIQRRDHAVVEGRRAPWRQLCQRQKLLVPRRVEGRNHFGAVGNRPHHRAILRLECPQKRLRRAHRQAQRLTCHAEAAVHAEGDRHRELPGDEHRNRLGGAVLHHLEIRRRETGHGAAVRPGHRGVYLHQLDAGGELGGELRRNAYPCQRHDQGHPGRAPPGWASPEVDVGRQHGWHGEIAFKNRSGSTGNHVVQFPWFARGLDSSGPDPNPLGAV